MEKTQSTSRKEELELELKILEEKRKENQENRKFQLKLINYILWPVIGIIWVIFWAMFNKW